MRFHLFPDPSSRSQDAPPRRQPHVSLYGDLEGLIFENVQGHVLNQRTGGQGVCYGILFLCGRPPPSPNLRKGDFATNVRPGVLRFIRSLFFGEGGCLMRGLTSARVVRFCFGRLVPARHFRESHMTWFSLAALTFSGSQTRQVCPLFWAKLPTDGQPRHGECNAGELPARGLISATRRQCCKALPRVWRAFPARLSGQPSIQLSEVQSL